MRPPGIVIARSAATKQSSERVEMDCFAALAMTKKRKDAMTNWGF